MPAIRACLEHRHSYVRRNAVLAIYTIYRCVDGSTSERQTSETIFSLSTNPRTTHAELWIIIGSEDLQKPPR